MDQKAKRVLEYNKIIELLRKQAGSGLTQDRIENLEPETDPRVVKDLLAETTEAVSVIVHKGPLPLGNFYDIKNHLELANKGGTLNMRQLLQVLYNINTARNVISFLKSDLPELPIIRGLSDLLVAPKDLSEEIDRCILSEDEMSDNASNELRNIRRSISRQNEAIRTKMNQILNSADNKVYLQDAIVTMRQGRYVIPVKSEHKNRFPGIVHDQSASGSTLFIEPQVIVNLNNELRELELAEKAEIERILSELTAQVALRYHELSNNQELLVQLDFIFAKGKLSYSMDGVEAIVSDNNILELLGARHPLIDPKKVVPINVSIGRGYKTLVITGPNTGGKTVTLKTIGLLTMMTQTGLHVPCVSGTRMPVFKKIFADIGDEQSIEQSLSTFSSHMTNIVNIVTHSDSQTLALLDELGAGTDPTEGAALAIAILRNLDAKNVTTVATTHYTELKKYAISTAGVENASMEFNVETLSPTYKLSIGIPGKSNAFEISKKLGLPGDIIDQARELLDSDALQFEEVISAIVEDKKLAEEMKDEALFINLSMKKQQEVLKEQERKLANQKDKIIAEAKEEARRIIGEAKSESDEIARELKELAKMDSLGERTKKFDETKKKIKSADSRYRDKLIVEENTNPMNPGDLKIGDRVRLLSLNQMGEVIGLPDDKGEVSVLVGLLKITSKLSDIVPVDVPQKKKTKVSYSKYGSLFSSKAKFCPISINVQGKILDDAVMDVDKYLDDAYIAGLKQVTVIHGRGEGILRKGLHDFLRTHKHVDSFRKGSYNEGGDGVTIVKIKEK